MQYCNVFLMLFCNNLTSACNTRSQAPAKNAKGNDKQGQWHKEQSNQKIYPRTFLVLFVIVWFCVASLCVVTLSNTIFFCPVHFWMLDTAITFGVSWGITYCARPVASANCSTSRGAFPLPCHLHRRPCPTGSYTAPGISRAGYGSLKGGDNPATRHHPKCTSSFRTSQIKRAFPFFDAQPLGQFRWDGNPLSSNFPPFSGSFRSPASLLGLPGSMAWDHPNCVHLPPLHAWPRGVQPARFQFVQPCAMVFPCQEGQETIVFACFHWSNLSLGSCDHAKDTQKTNKTPIQHQSIQNWAPMENSWKFYQWPTSISYWKDLFNTCFSCRNHPKPTPPRLLWHLDQIHPPTVVAPAGETLQMQRHATLYSQRHRYFPWPWLKSASRFVDHRDLSASEVELKIQWSMLQMSEWECLGCLEVKVYSVDCLWDWM